MTHIDTQKLRSQVIGNQETPRWKVVLWVDSVWLAADGWGKKRWHVTDQKWMTAEQVLRMYGWRERCLWRWCLVANDHRQQRQYHFLLPRPLPARCYTRKGSSGVARWCQITNFASSTASRRQLSVTKRISMPLLRISSLMAVGTTDWRANAQQTR